jgi:hypothetical protein
VALRPDKKKTLISSITNKLWSFFSTLGHLYIPQKFQVRTIIPSGCSAFGDQCIRIPTFHQTIFLFIFVFTLNLIAKTVNGEFSIQNSKVYKTMIKKISWAVHHQSIIKKKMSASPLMVFKIKANKHS